MWPAFVKNLTLYFFHEVNISSISILMRTVKLTTYLYVCSNFISTHEISSYVVFPLGSDVSGHFKNVEALM